MLNFDWLAALPLSAAKGIILLLFGSSAFLVYRLDFGYIHAGLENPRWYHNLKIWSVGLLSLIAITYLYF